MVKSTTSDEVRTRFRGRRWPGFLSQALMLAATLFGGAIAAGQATDEEPDEAATAATVAALGQKLADAQQQPKAAIEAIAALATPPERAVAALREFDRANAYPPSEAGVELRRELYRALGRSGDFRSMHYLKETFEAQPSRRVDATLGFVAFAARHGRRMEEWQYLVRSLPFLDAVAAVPVLQSLATFPQRGSKPQWQREVILAGLRCQEADQGAAVAVLEAWTDAKPASPDDSPAKKLKAWQTWFDDRNPDLPPAQLPVDPPTARHPLEQTAKLVHDKLAEGDVRRGAAVYEKAQCGKCHRRAGQGEAMGPDLTSAPNRYDERQLLETILFPSQSTADDYGAVTVLTRAGRAYTGVVNAAAGKVVILQSNGEKATLARQEIEEISPSRRSAMPDGLLDAFDDQQVIDLVAFLLDREPR